MEVWTDGSLKEGRKRGDVVPRRYKNIFPNILFMKSETYGTRRFSKDICYVLTYPYRQKVILT